MAFLLFATGIFAGLMFSVFYFGAVRIDNGQMTAIPISYPDLAAVMLSAVSVLVTILGIGVAVLALWGYSQFKQMAKEAASAHVENELREGSLKNDFEELILKHVKNELEHNPALRTLLVEQVDRIILSDAARRAQAEAIVNEETEYGD